MCKGREIIHTYGLLVAVTNGSTSNSLAGGEDIHDLAKVREARHDIVRVARSHRARLRGRSGRRARGILAIVARRHGDEGARIDQRVGRVVGGLAEAPAERHVDGDAVRAAAGRVVARREVHGVEDRGAGRDAVVVEDLEGEEARLLRHAVRVRPDDARHVGAVAGAVVVVAVSREVLQPLGPPPEVLVVHVDPGVDHVRARPVARRVVEVVVAAPCVVAV